MRDRLRALPGLLALAVVLGVVGSAFAGLIAAAGPASFHLPWRYLGRLLAFSFGQAALSTVLALIMGALLALSLARRSRFPGRGIFVSALNLASVLPAIVAVFGIIAVYGRSGWLGQAASALGLDLQSWIFGLPGILIAHVFFNAPVAARVFLAALDAVPGEHWRLAAHLGMPPSAVFRILDRPVLLRELPGVAGLIFLLCFTSFAIVLSLGGGPPKATLEVAIYEAVRFDTDFGRAGLLAAIQLLISLALLGSMHWWFARRPAEAAATGAWHERPDARSPALRALDVVAITVGALLIVPPLLAILLSGLAAAASLFQAGVARAALTSIAIAIPAGTLSVLLALGLASLVRRLRLDLLRPRSAGLVGVVGILLLAIPPVALSAGLFVALRPLANPFAIAAPLIVLVNGLMAMPHALRQIEPPLLVAAERYGRLADSLGVHGTNRLRWIEWPLLKRPAIVAFTVAAALSLGDLGVASLFGSGNLTTLPLLIYERMGAYRLDEAASVSLLLAALVLLFFLIAHRWSGGGLARGR